MRRPTLVTLFLALLLLMLAAPVAAQQAGPTTQPDGKLRLYGAGGPFGPMQESLAAFTVHRGVEGVITAGPTGNWLERASADGDLVFLGAEYVMDAFEFGRTYGAENRLVTENLIIPESRTVLYTRPSGILVRPGNPKNIQTFEDLARPGIQVLTVQGAGQTGVWEEMAARAGVMNEVQANISIVAGDGADAIRQWDSHPELDAWVTWESWWWRLKNTTDLVSVPDDLRVYRGTPIAIFKRTQHRDIAEEFIRFLQTPARKQIFANWGWADPPR